MRISCYCCTYNRPPRYQKLLDEAVESFLRQDYPDKELVILNDCPGQELICDAPGVTVINLPRRFGSTGEKFNAAIGLTVGEVLVPWDDDDICLPWRLSLSLERMDGADYYNPRRYWLLNSRGLQSDHQMSLGWGTSMFTRLAFDLVGGFPHRSGDADQVLHQRLTEHPGVRVAEVPTLSLDEWYYVYRWGASPAHISSRRPYDEWYKEIGKKPVEPGKYVVRPEWKVDYVAAVRGCLS